MLRSWRRVEPGSSKLSALTTFGYCSRLHTGSPREQATRNCRNIEGVRQIAGERRSVVAREPARDCRFDRPERFGEDDAVQLYCRPPPPPTAAKLFLKAETSPAGGFRRRRASEILRTFRATHANISYQMTCLENVQASLPNGYLRLANILSPIGGRTTSESFRNA